MASAVAASGPDPAVSAAGGVRRPRFSGLPWWLPAATLVIGGHLVTAWRLGGVVATDAEARIAAAAAAMRLSGFAADPLPFADALGARQLAVLATVLPLDALSTIDAARLACLLAGAVAALLTWPVLRALGAPAPAAAVGVVLAGASAPALTLHAGVASAAPAAAWLTLAAVLATRLRRPGPALPVAALAVLTAPLAVVALLALLAHLLLDGTVRVPRRARRPLGIAVAAAAVGLVVPVASPSVAIGGPVVDTPAALAGAAAGTALVLVAHRLLPWLRAVLTPVLVLLVLVAVPGPARVTAALLVLPGLAVVAGMVAGALAERLARPAPAAAVAIVLVVGLAATAAGDGPPRGPAAAAAGGMAGWAVAQLPPGTPVRADALDRAELAAAGLPVDALRGPADPPAPGEVLLLTPRPPAAAPAADGCPPAATLAGTDEGTGGSASVLCRTDGSGSADGAPVRTRLGGALAGNPALSLDPAAADLLRAGAVDTRVIAVLAAMSSARRLVVAGFPAVDLDVPGAPRRQVLITAVDGAPAAGSPLLPTWLDGQQPPFVPARVTPAGDALLVTWFALPDRSGGTP
ncbi:hypothetical protein PHY01_27640 [Pseudonocardia hydrocarbonoxydans]|uniref:Glycosyltransferase RgtA/B/C/D-like domain-containing protein n=1 Tax=Pseudonocardia hydrocarbonoxydans TaxID=76726 RepID=A0A4Y3WQC1_9PSEU|nr:hypothetical protein PHY01_27640 [Pseudonocardia hydrocarbonoxydans]